MVDMPFPAQATRVYDDYLEKLSAIPFEELPLLAVTVVGPRHRVAKLVGRFELPP